MVSVDSQIAPRKFPKLHDLWSRISSSILALILAAVVPIVAGTVVLKILLANEIRDSKEQELYGIARAISASVDAQLAAGVHFAESLAATENVRRGDLARFDAGTRAMLATQPGLTSIVVTDLTTATYPIHTSMPPGANAPAGPTSLEEGRLVATAGRSIIFPVRPSGPTVSEAIIPIRTPILRDGQITQILTVSLSPKYLSNIYSPENFRPTLTGAVIDPNHAIAGRNRNIEQFAGKKITQPLEEAIVNKTQGIFKSVNQEGNTTYAVFVRSPTTGWLNVVGAPQSEIDSEIYRVLVPVILGGGFTSLIGIGFASFIGMRIRSQQMDEREFAATLKHLVDEQTIELKASSDQLQTSNSILISALETMEQGIAVFDKDERLVMFNRIYADDFPAGSEVLKIGTSAEALQRAILERRASVSRPGMSMEEALAERLDAFRRADGKVLRRELSDGRVYHISHHRLPDGGTILSRSEVTEQLALESQLREAQKMDAIGKLTGGMAHDFNNYLGVIIGNLDLAREDKSIAPASMKLIDGALRGAERSAELTQSLLAFSRRQPLKPQIVDLNKRLKTVCTLLKRSLGEDISLFETYGPDLWPVKIDGAQLDSCIVNLANNARDAMPDGGKLTIATRNDRLDEDYAETQSDVTPGDYVLIEVTDAGSGMPPETLAKVFDPFFTTKPVGHGTGLGLSMVFGFVKQSGGHVAIYSQLGLGTTVRIYLPRVTEDVTATIDAPQIDVPQGSATVLVVEDNAMVREATLRQITSLGYRVISAEDATAALAIIEKTDRHIDILFSDVVMPGSLNGFGLASLAEKLRPNLKIVLTSGFPSDALGSHEKHTAKYVLLGKPYRKTQLAKVLSEAITIG
jgi:signal transduction histidine kinase